MEISALTSTLLTQNRIEIEKQQQKTDNFKSILDAAVAKEDDKQLRAACAEFESYFLYIMLKEMRKTVNKDSNMLYSHTEEIFQSLLDEEYGKAMSKSGGIGLADMMYRQMKLQYSGVGPKSEG